MLYIITQVGHEFEWHVKEKPLTIQPHLITQLFADGDELELIREELDGIPNKKTARGISWFGDTAKFIAFAIGAASEDDH